MTPDRAVGAPIENYVPTFVKVRKKTREYQGVATLELDTPSDKAWTALKPGQFTMLYAFGVGEIPISFSVLSPKQKRLVHTIRDAGAVSGALTRLKRGDCVGVRGPFGAGWPMDKLKVRDVVIIAGGLGLAPLRPVIDHLALAGDKRHSITVLYGAREPETLLFKKNLEQWMAETDIDVRITVDTAALDWRGDVGLVTSLIPNIGIRPDQTVVFMCGPEIMMRHTAETLVGAGLRDTDIWLSMERNMKCAVGFCGRCQFGPSFICRDGPVFQYSRIRSSLFVKEL